MATMRRSFLFPLILGMSSAAGIAPAGSVSSGPLRVDYPEVGQSGPIRIFYKGTPVVADNWYSLATDKAQQANTTVLSQGVVTEAVAAPLEKGGMRLRVVRRADSAIEPDLGSFDLTYELRGGEGVIRHSMTLTPFGAVNMLSCSFLVKFEGVDPQTTQFHFLGQNQQVKTEPWPATPSSPRIAALARHPTLAMEDKKMGGIVALGAQPTGVKSLVFNPDLPGFDLTRQGMAVTADRPLQT
ncbi:MAG: hypothetical protein NTW86_28710, partial [Candidatus Sumerlaeota bacterium]|nr:hypothetical protein [Candidatus Sumerlaeota bacterium]